ncbi:MAG: DUF5719 family protein [Candidatus Geothermincolia bacterium]
MQMRLRARNLRFTIVVVCLFTIMLITTTLASVASASGALPGSITVRLEFKAPKIASGPGGTSSVSIEGCSQSRPPGLPVLPGKAVTLATPPGSTAYRVTVTGSAWKRYAVPHKIEWGKPAAPSAGDLPEALGPDRKVYESASPYPEAAAELADTGMQRNISAATVRVNPVIYYPAADYLEAASYIEVRIDCRANDAASAALSDRKPALPDAAVFDNATEARSWYGQADSKRKALASGTGNTADYVIITTAALSASVASLQTYKESQGLSVNVTTTEWISANCSGADDSEKIRNFLRDRYASWGITYVLIVGTDASVPMRRCYTPNGEGADQQYTPTDYYYSDLSGATWDLNSDGNYGQYGVDDEAGGVDFYPEVYVGRIPNSTPADVASICDKIVAFSQDAGAWKHKALLLGAASNFENENSTGWPATWGSLLCEALKTDVTTPAGITNYTMYEQAGLAVDPNPSDAALTNANVLAEWPNDYGLVTWWGHGSNTSSVRKVWASDDGNGIPEGAECSWSNFISSANTPSLDNTHPGIVFSVACNNAYADDTGSLAASLVKAGASAVVGATRISWYSIGWEAVDWGGNATLGYLFDQNVVTGGQRLGKALRLADIEFLNNYLYFGSDDYMNLYDFNLFGDPSMRLDAEGAPTVSGVVPNSHENTGSVAVTVTGGNFMTGAGVKLARVGQPDVQATSVSVESPGSITCSLALDDVLWGSWDVVVTNPDDSFGTLPAGFTITCPTPTLSTVTPSSGAAGTSVHISDLEGTGFRSSAAVQLQKDGQAPIDATNIVCVSDSQITCDFDLTGAVVGQWSVFIENGGGKNATMPNSFTVTFPAPTIDSISPVSGNSGGTVVIDDLAGTNFRSGATVKLRKGGQADIDATSVNVVSANKITCEFDLTGKVAGAWDVIVTNDDAQEATLAGGFTVLYGAPTISTILPTGGYNNDPALDVTDLHGTNFRPGATVKLTRAGQPDITATNVNVTASQITCTLDLNGKAVGLWSVVVTNDDAQIATLTDGFTISYPWPTAASISPSIGYTDQDTIAITDLHGSNFRSGATVKFRHQTDPPVGPIDTVDATDVTVVSPAQITCNVSFPVDLRDSSHWDVLVTNDDAKTATITDGFFLEHPAPTVASIVPDSGVNDGTVPVEVNGTNYMSDTGVVLEKTGKPDVPLAITDRTPTKITCELNLVDQQYGLRNVKVRNHDNKTATLADGFTVLNPTPRVDSITPPSGTRNSSVTCTIMGADFRQPDAVIRLVKAGQPDIVGTDLSFHSETEWGCTFPLDNAALGTWDLVVTNPVDLSDTLAGCFTVVSTPPVITSLTPDSGSVGDAVTIDGTSLGNSRGSSTVSFNGTEVTEYDSWSDTRIVCKVPRLASTGGVQVKTINGTSNKKTFAVVEVTAPTWYLAEGTSDYGFDTYIDIENPNAVAVTAEVTYMTKTGPRSRAALTLPALSQTVINPRNDLGVTDFSTKVVCREGKTICVDRRIIWTGAGAVSQEGHASVGVTAPARTWYLAEGSSKWGFESWLLVQNPSSQEARLTITYMVEGQGPVPIAKTVPANSRASFNMETDIGKADASMKVESSVPVIAERAMYRNNRREGHDSIGATAPARDFYLAEGSTDWGFTTFVLVQNPGSSAATINITYMTPTGAVPQAAFTMEPNSRKTINVNSVVEKKDVSIRVHGSVPIIAERAMYWDKGAGEACHDSIGMALPHMTFYLPDGETYNGMETWTLVQNPNSAPVTVEISYLTLTGTGNVTFTETVAANSRKSFNMADKLPSTRASVIVRSKTAGKAIMVERAMYWNNRGAGTVTIGGYSN